MKRVIKSVDDIFDFSEDLRGVIQDIPVIVEVKRWEANSWPMKKTWRMWMSEIAKHMADAGVTMPLMINKDGKIYGRRPFDEKDAHELFVRQFLGVDENGDRYKTASGDKGKMLNMMDEMISWATERGISLTIPGDGEYMKLKKETEIC